jgi:SPP1 gp7 family putative phage head morphogenesis protein
VPDPIETVVRGAIERQQMGNALARDEVVILRRAFEDIAAQLARRDPTAVSGAWQRKRLKKLSREIADILKKADAEQYALAKRELAKIGGHEGARAVALLGSEGVKAPIAPALFRELLVNEPIRGVFLRDWFKDATDATIKGVNQQIRIGVAEHETIGQIMRRVRGVEAPNVVPRTGEFAKATRRATAITRTAVTDISNKAARRVYTANDDLTKEFRYVATLDSRTTEICMGLDGQTFGYDDDDARYPPQHINCRSTIVPVLLDPIGKPGKRASADGPVPADTNYEDWLRGKSAAEQNAILGPSRAELFRDGKISLRDLVRSDGTAKTVEELSAG